jgi:hypothetical protein
VSWKLVQLLVSKPEKISGFSFIQDDDAQDDESDDDDVPNVASGDIDDGLNEVEEE